MKVLIAGAAGPLGQALVREALKNDHIVTALVRSATQIAGLAKELADQNLNIVAGDVLQSGALDRPMAAQDAVICSLGVRPALARVTALSEGTGNIIRAMQRHNVRRLLCITGIGAGNSIGHGGFLYDQVIQPLFLKTMYEDKNRQERLVEDCDRDWVLIRPARLKSGKAVGRFSAITKMRGLCASSISRSDVAKWTVRQLATNLYLYRPVVLTE